MSIIPSTRRLRSHRVTLTWDCLVLVFKECDKATLAALGRVSIDILAAMAPLLYRTVEIKSLSGLRSLFCERTPTDQSTSRCDGLLALGHIQYLSLVVEPIRDPLSPRSLDISPARAAGILPLKVDSFHISAPHQDNDAQIWDLLYKELFSGSRLLDWSRLATMSVQGAIPITGVTRTRNPNRICGLDRPLPKRRRTIRFEVSSLNGTESLVRYISEKRWKSCFDRKQPGSVVFVTETVEEKVELETEIQTYVEANWRTVFVVEVKP